jgi:hypothetical protein
VVAGGEEKGQYQSADAQWVLAEGRSKTGVQKLITIDHIIHYVTQGRGGDLPEDTLVSQNIN